MRALRLIAIPLLALSISCASNTTPTTFAACTPHSLTSIGKALPDCTFEGFNGSPTLKLSSLRGKPSVLNFWASWCSECIGEMPAFQKVFESLAGKVAFVGMNVIYLSGETMGAGRAFAKRTGVRYQLAFDPRGLLYAHFGAFRLTLPITVFVDARGIVKDLNFGALDEKSLRQKIRTDFSIT